MLSDFFDRFKPKHDGTLPACLAAMNHFRPLLAEWKEHDEFRLSLEAAPESNFGWGSSMARLGIIHSTDKRPLLAYACTHGEGNGSRNFQMQAETLNESLTFMMRNNTYVEVYYLNYPIGSITTDFCAFDLNGTMVMKCRPCNPSAIGTGYSAIGPAPFVFASGINGWYNIPPHGNHVADRDAFIRSRAIGISKNHMPHDYERRWMIAMWLFLRVGPWTVDEWPTGFFNDNDMWLDFFIPDSLFD